ncbi:hypothetical protein B0H14DRAFT_2975483 [Mycena olivaceomarginata]|nr:hypothetical protein B0H14DRAFT_2975483 [Mycena olivaceomarginata]
MPNLVDDAPVGPGEILLPPDSDATEPVQLDTRLPKFRRRVFYVVTICCALLLVTFWLVRRPERVGPGVPGAPFLDIADDARLEPYQTPENAEYCADWFARAEDDASVSFELPTDADLLLFLSRGPISGEIFITKTPDYSNGPDLERTKVCRMGAANEHGVLLWAEPRHPHGDPKRDVSFNIEVALPTGVRDYKDLTTDLALFSHRVDGFFDLWSPTSFEVVRLKTSNALMSHGSLVGRAGFFQTSNAKVEGFFCGYEYAVQTSNAPIDATALMFGESAGSESQVQLKTSNGEINANLGIISDYANNILRAVVETSNAPLTLQTRLTARNASFFLDATASAAAATLHLDPQYEGPYDLQTTVALASVIETEADDPSGTGRRRTVTRKSTGHHAQGNIYWSQDGEPPSGFERGSVKFATTVFPVELHI